MANTSKDIQKYIGGEVIRVPNQVCTRSSPSLSASEVFLLDEFGQEVVITLDNFDIIRFCENYSVENGLHISWYGSGGSIWTRARHSIIIRTWLASRYRL